MARKIKNAGFYIDVQGIDETIAKINVFQTKKILEVKTVIKETANKAKKEAKSRAPKLTGDTKASISTKFYDNGLHARVKPKLPKGYKAHWHEYGTVKMSATPFMSVAEELVKNDYNSKLKSIVNGETRI